MTYSGFLAVVAGINPADNEVSYDDKVNSFRKTSDTLVRKFLGGTLPMIVSGSERGLSDTGLLIWMAMNNNPNILLRQTGLLNPGSFNQEKLNKYLLEQVPEDLLSLILITADLQTDSAMSVPVLGGRGPIMNLREGVVWADNGKGTSVTIYEHDITSRRG